MCLVILHRLLVDEPFVRQMWHQQSRKPVFPKQLLQDFIRFPTGEVAIDVYLQRYKREMAVSAGM